MALASADFFSSALLAGRADAVVVEPLVVVVVVELALDELSFVVVCARLVALVGLLELGELTTLVTLVTLVGLVVEGIAVADCTGVGTATGTVVAVAAGAAVTVGAT